MDITVQRILEILDGSNSGGFATGPESIIISLLLAFVLGQILAWVYFYTHSGLSYSKSFVQSLIVITVVVALVMSTISNSFVTAVGLMGALSIIRFRNMIKDTRDIAFIFCSLVVGMATGAQRYDVAIIGTLALSAIVIYLHITDFGTHRPHNGFLRFNIIGHIGPNHPVPAILKRYCRHVRLISAQDHDFGDPVVEYAYQLMIKNTAKNEQMLAELNKVENISNISLTIQEQLLEV